MPIWDKAQTRFYYEFDWDGRELLLQSRAQPTKGELRKHRGVNSIYHNNGIQTWHVHKNGEVENVEVSSARRRCRRCWPSVWAAWASCNRPPLPIPKSAAPAAKSLPTKRLGIGRTATSEEIAGWDIDIRPDGQGLPLGKGTVKQGEPLYVERCAACHGEFGESAGRWPILMGGAGTLASHRGPTLDQVLDRLVLALRVHGHGLHPALDAVRQRAVADQRRVVRHHRLCALSTTSSKTRILS